VLLEVVADHWIWHAFFGMVGSHNDINVLQCSQTFARLIEGHARHCDYEINVHQFTKDYYLSNGIYQKWSTFMKTISDPLGQKNSHFVSWKESCRKNVDRTFSVPQTRFAIVRYPDFTCSQ
jgi:hypothetical protein